MEKDYGVCVCRFIFIIQGTVQFISEPQGWECLMTLKSNLWIWLRKERESVSVMQPYRKLTFIGHLGCFFYRVFCFVLAMLFSVFFCPASDYHNDPNNTEVFQNKSTVTSEAKAFFSFSAPKSQQTRRDRRNVKVFFFQS